MKHSVIVREEMQSAFLNFGGAPIALADYATTGLVALAVGPRGFGKTNAGLLCAEQLAEQGWVSVLIDPEGELESLYGSAVGSVKALQQRLEKRDKPIVVVSISSATEFTAYGNALLEAADRFRKPVFLMVDETQLFSGARPRKGPIAEAAQVLNEMAERGRKRALDLFVSSHRYTGTLNRSLFANKNLTLIGCQEDPTAWTALAPQCRAARIGFSDLNALAPGEFYCFSRRGAEKLRLPLAKALQGVAPAAKPVKPILPTTFNQWDRAVRAIPTERLLGLSEAVIDLLSAVACLTPQQIQAGIRALDDELEARR